MKVLPIFLALVAFATAQEASNIWAVLVAGSDGWYNYRHQADVCHAYQVLHNHGVPDEQIIVFMTDDLAENKENPTPGTIINHLNGPNVYTGVPKDYTKDQVTVENFQKVLLGQKPTVGSGKTLKSGPNDFVFVNFVDHGATNIIAFPTEEMTTKQLNTTLQTMYTNKQFKQLLFYLEACESGSMFSHTLGAGTNIFATTAANPTESSYACYYDSKLGTYLGDVYSVNWMEDSDKENLDTETLLKQFQIVKKETNTSHVQMYGDEAIDSEDVGVFQGEKEAEPITYPPTPFDAVSSRDVPLYILQNKLAAATTDYEKALISDQISLLVSKRSLVTHLFDGIASEVAVDETQAKMFINEKLDASDIDCHHDVVTFFSANCFSIAKNYYSMKFMQSLANMCQSGVSVADIQAGIAKACAKFPKDITNII